MNKKEIKKLLHHREPYLMVDEVIESSPKSIHTKKIHDGNEPHVQGHFPNMPVVPGAMLQEFCTQSAGILMTQYHSPVKDYDSEKTKGWAIGVLNKIQYAKYLGIVKPDKVITAKVDLYEKENNLFKFKAKVFQQGKLKAKLSFNLVIAKDEILF
jgi:3-hydroxyacyl-[acyl-carrier-protein] dehydratase